MSIATKPPSAAVIKAQARGREVEILIHFGYPPELLDGKNHPCPLCKEGTDRFRLIDAQAGAVLCNQCFNKENGDFIAAVQKITGLGFKEALQAIADYLGTSKPRAAVAKPAPPSKQVTTYRTAAEAEAIYSRYPCERRSEFLSRAGDLLAVDLRLRINGEKSYRPISQRPDGQWITGNVNPRPLYGMERFDGAEQIDVFEGAKAADAGTQCGLITTTWMGGTPAVKLTDWSQLANLPGLKVVNFHPDHDDVGEEAMRTAEKTVRKLNPKLQTKIVKTPEIIALGPASDIADLVEKYPDDARAMIQAAIDATAISHPEAQAVIAPLVTSAVDGYPDIRTHEGQTEESNARRLIHRRKDRLLWCSAWKSWRAFDGQRWAPNETMIAESWAREIVTGLWAEMASVANSLDAQAIKNLISFIRGNNTAYGIKSLLQVAQTLPGVAVAPSEFNSDHWLFNVQNGTIDLRTGAIRAHDPADKITQISPVVFDPSARCPLWEAFIDAIFCGDQELIRYVRGFLGYSLTGDVGAQELPLCYGKGANGKGTLFNTMLGILGDYAMTATPELLMAGGRDQSNGLADLYGKRLVVTSEPDEGSRLNESVVKTLTGGDAIRARRLYENLWEFWPTHKILLAANHKPIVRGDDHGIWRRLKLVPFRHKFEGESRIDNYADKLRGEWPGILNWLLAGLADWRVNGLVCPQAVQDASEEYRKEQDTLADWLAECCNMPQSEKLADSFKAKGSHLYASYATWTGTGALSQTAFGTKLATRFKKVRNNGIWYHGLQLKPEHEKPKAQDGQDNG